MNLIIKQNNQTVERVSSELIDLLYNLAKADTSNGGASIAIIPNDGLQGRIEATVAYQDAVDYLNERFGPNFIVSALSYYIRFYDPEVVSVLKTKNVIPDSGGLTSSQAESLPTGNGSANQFWWSGNKEIKRFDEINCLGRCRNGSYEMGQWFTNATNLESVDLTGFTNLRGFLLFKGCSNLKYFHGYGNEPENTLNLTDLTNINATFEGCTKLYHITSLGVASILTGDIFKSCSNLEDVNLPAQCAQIQHHAFYGCTNLTTINIDNLAKIDSSAFQSCANLEYCSGPNSTQGELYLPNLTGTLGESAFKGCMKLTSVTSLGSVTAIGSNTFENCALLATINFPNTITSVGANAFKGTAWLNAQSGLIYIGACLHFAKGDVGTTINITPGTVSISNDCFYNAGTIVVTSNVMSITVPDSVTTIGSSAFRKLSYLTTLNLGNGVKTIARDALADLSSLQSLSIPASLTSIGIDDGALRGSTALTSVTVDSNNPKYDSRDNCNAIIETTTNKLIAGCKASTIPNTVISIGNYAFKEVGITSVTIPNSVTSLGTRCFYGCKGLTSATIPASIVTFGEKTFEQCTGLASVTLENGLQSLATFMFQACSSLTSIVIPNSVISFNDGGTFLACSSLSSITLPDNMTSIPWCFLEGTAITSLTVPAGVTTIGSRAINACKQLRTLTMLPTTPPTLVASDSLKNFHADLLIYVPSGSVDAYKTANGWKDIPNINNRVLAIT